MLVIKHEAINYCIFLPYDDQTCFKCHLAGHITRKKLQKITEPKTTLTVAQDNIITRNANAATNETMESEDLQEKGRSSLEASINKGPSPSTDSPVAEPSIPSSERFL